MIRTAHPTRPLAHARGDKRNRRIEDLVTFGRYSDPAVAQDAKSALTDAGIEPVVAGNEEEIDVFVHEADGERAVDVLTKKTRDLVCPACGSRDIERAHKLAIFMVLVAATYGLELAINLPSLAFFATVIIGGALLLAPSYRCTACGKRFDPNA